MVMKCGHHMCLSCTLDMLNASKLHGTLYNIVAHSRFENPNRACCPFCRYKHALVDFELFGIA